MANLKSNSSNTTTKKISISILVISLPLLYMISLLHLPLSSLFKDTKFWFLISNSIIIIVAVDSGMFTSSSSPSDDLYDEYMKMKQIQTNQTSFKMRSYTGLKDEKSPPDEKLDPEKEKSCSASIKDYRVSELDRSDSERTMEIGSSPVDQQEIIKEMVFGEKESSKDVRVEPAVVEEKAVVLRELPKCPPPTTVKEKRRCGMEESEYWKMSDEELNRKVEEFINRFNREIRLQNRMMISAQVF